MKLLIAASMAAAASRAITIKSACMTKLEQVGNLSSENGVAFNQWSYIYNNLDTESIPTKANVCVMIENQALILNLFSLTMDLADGTKPVEMPNVGPQTIKSDFICTSVDIANPAAITGIAIYYNDSIVTQVDLFAGQQTTTVGSKGANDQLKF